MLNIENALGQQPSLAHMGMLLDNVNGGIMLCKDAPGYPIVYVNEGFSRLTGYSHAELEAILLADSYGLVYPEDVSLVCSGIEQQLSDHEHYDIRYRLVRKDGTCNWVWETGMWIQLGEHRLIQCLLTDISAIKKTEQDLRISEKRYQLAMAFADVTLFDYDIVTKQMHLHRADVEEYNIPQTMENSVETLISLGVIQPRSYAAMRALYHRIESGAPTSSAVVHAKNEEGADQVLELSLATIYDDEGRPVSAVGVKRDITQSMVMKRELEYVNTLVSGKNFLYEADLNRDRILSMDSDWQELMRKTSSNISTLTGMIRWACRNHVDPAHSEMVLKKMSPKRIIDDYQRGERLFRMEFRQKDPFTNGQYEWYEQTINIIRDAVSGNLIVRAYWANINFEKNRQLRAYDEQRFYAAMAAKNIVNYEMNLTRDLYVANYHSSELGQSCSGSYSQLITSLANSSIHPDDRNAFLDAFGPEDILERFQQGIADMKVEYRRREGDDRYIWVSSTLHVFADEHTGELKGFSYVEKIDEQKKKQLELIYKSQYDQLTGMLNKATLEEKISDFFDNHLEHSGVSAFLLIDLDCFKDVNDTFGHIFGDAVLSRFSTKIRSLFRDGDYIGRIGGDEFAVLMKNARDYGDVAAKAQEICAKVSERYNKDGIEVMLSCSVGVAFYGIHGISYQELYRNSDTALYEAKRLGKHRYVQYTLDMSIAESQPDAAHRRTIFEDRRFEDNALEYMLRILHEQRDDASSVESVLEMLGNHYGLSRIAIFERGSQDQPFTSSFRWTAPGLDAPSGSMGQIPVQYVEQWRDFFNDGVLYVADCDSSDLPLELRKLMRQYGVKSMVQFPFCQGTQEIGLISFEQCDHKRVPTRAELSDWRSMSLLLGVFIVNLRRTEQLTYMLSRKRKPKKK